MLLHRVADSIASSGNRDVQRSAEAAGATADATLGRVLDAKRRTLGLARADAAAGRTVGLLRYGDFNVVLNPPAVSVALMDGIVRGDTAAAVRELDSAGAQLRWTTLAPVDRPYTPYALAYAQVHRPDKARALLVRMTAEVRDTSLLRTWQPMIHQTLGEIALDEHQPRVAMDESRKADSLPDGPANGDPLPILVNLGRAFDQANQSDSAIVYFERYLAAPSIYRAQDDAVYLAGVHRRLGELYEARHDNAKAIAHYNTLIQLWKSADPDLQPVVAEMRRRVTRLERAAGG
jgi:tetratricopeptide (TPR) repeat protein